MTNPRPVRECLEATIANLTMVAQGFEYKAARAPSDAMASYCTGRAEGFREAIALLRSEFHQYLEPTP